jgi:hypothetical protein
MIVSNEKSLKANIKKINYDKYLPIGNSFENKMPIVKAYSYRSKLIDEKNIENIFKTYLNQITNNYKNEDNSVLNKMTVNSENKLEGLKLIEKLDKSCK